MLNPYTANKVGEAIKSAFITYGLNVHQALQLFHHISYLIYCKSFNSVRETLPDEDTRT